MGSNVRACAAVRCAVVGHVEWVDSVLVDRVPGAGEIAHGAEDWSEPAGGGAVAAAQLVKLAGACDFFTALGDDEHGRRSVARFRELEIDADVEWFGSTRRAFVQVDAHGERTITTVGAGDSFGAALTFALGRGDELEVALAFAARAGAAVITGKGPYTAQLDARRD